MMGLGNVAWGGFHSCAAGPGEGTAGALAGFGDSYQGLERTPFRAGSGRIAGGKPGRAGPVPAVRLTWMGTLRLELPGQAATQGWGGKGRAEPDRGRRGGRGRSARRGLDKPAADPAAAKVQAAGFEATRWTGSGSAGVGVGGSGDGWRWL